MLADLEKIGVDGEKFDEKLSEFAAAVNEHASNEEREVFPRLREHLSAEKLDTMRDALIMAEGAAPTHPHPHGPESAIGNAIVGPFAAIVDRVRDALHEHTKR